MSSGADPARPDVQPGRSGPFVVAVSGTSGAGKSTLVRGLVEAWQARGTATASLLFDDFAADAELPEADLAGWLDRGADPDEWRTDRMAAELRRLRSGGPTHRGPTSGVELVIVEEPFGRGRRSTGPLIDLGLHIELPPHVALARRLLRQFLPAGAGSDVGDPQGLRDYLTGYLRHGAAAYQVIADVAAGTADVVLDGLLDPTELQQRSMAEIAARRGR